MQGLWESILPGYPFAGIGWVSFLLAIVGSFAGGFLAAVIIVPICNFFAERQTLLVMQPGDEYHEPSYR